MKNIAKECFKRAKITGDRLYITDSTNLELSGYKFLASLLIIKSILEERDLGEIAIMLPTSSIAIVVNIAISSMGKRIINLNYTSQINSLKSAIKLADIDSIVTSRLFISKLKQRGFEIEPIFENLNIVYLEDIKRDISPLKKLKSYLIAKFTPLPILIKLYVADVPSRDTAVIMFSSGSEGTPKGIELTHNNILGNIEQISPLLDIRDDDVMLGTLPIFHSFGLTVTTLFPIIKGILVVAHSDPIDGYTIAKLSLKYKATIMFGTPTFFKLYAKNRKIHPLMFKSLRLVVAGAERLSKETVELFKIRFLKEILQGYGTTETSPVASCNLPDEINPDNFQIKRRNRPNSVGRPILGTDFIVVEPESMKKLDVGEKGMLLVSGVQVMKGYLKDKKRSREVLREIDGKIYYMTGDKGYIDSDGFIYIVDRYSRFAKIGGEMISLGAVEEQISKLIDNSVAQVAITAVSDNKKGEKIIALLEGDIKVKTLKSRVREAKIDSLYTPSEYFVVDEIPKLGTGKSDFKEIKRLAEKLLLQKVKI